MTKLFAFAALALLQSACSSSTTINNGPEPATDPCAAFPGYDHHRTMLPATVGGLSECSGKCDVTVAGSWCCAVPFNDDAGTTVCTCAYDSAHCSVSF